MRRFLILYFTFTSICFYSQCTQTFAAGDWSNFVIKTDGTLWGWGYRNFSPSITYYPTNIGTANDWESVSGGGSKFIAKKSNGTLWSNGYSIIGGSSGPGPELIQIGTDSDWQTYSIGTTHANAVKTNGTLWGWGENYSGAVGYLTDDIVHNPIQIGTDSNWNKVFAGPFHSLGIKTDGTLWAWGRGSTGQLGNGTYIYKSAPVQVNSTGVWIYATAGSDRSFGIKSDGTLWGWGRNYYGQLGNGNTIYQSTPVQIGTDNNWVQVVSYNNSYDSNVHNELCGYTVALKSNGTLWQWGYGDQGPLLQLPTQIGTANDWQKIDIGVRHYIAQKTDGSLWTWGLNAFGVIGIGNTDTGLIFPAQLVNCGSFVVLSSEEFVANQKLHISPNPVQNQLYVKGIKDTSEYEIINMFGLTLKKGAIYPNSAIDIDEISSGMYFIKIDKSFIKFIKK